MGDRLKVCQKRRLCTPSGGEPSMFYIVTWAAIQALPGRNSCLGWISPGFHGVLPDYRCHAIFIIIIKVLCASWIAPDDVYVMLHPGSQADVGIQIDPNGACQRPILQAIFFTRPSKVLRWGRAEMWAAVAAGASLQWTVF
jgi:hypothetical protein